MGAGQSSGNCYAMQRTPASAEGLEPVAVFGGQLDKAGSEWRRLEQDSSVHLLMKRVPSGADASLWKDHSAPSSTSSSSRPSFCTSDSSPPHVHHSQVSPSQGSRFPPVTPSLDSLPPELLLRVLAHLPRSDWPAARCVCSAWRAAVGSPDFLRLRRSLGLSEPWLYAVEWMLKGPRNSLALLWAFNPQSSPGQQWQQLGCLPHVWIFPLLLCPHLRPQCCLSRGLLAPLAE